MSNKTMQIGNLIIDRDRSNVVRFCGRCKACGSGVYYWVCDFDFPLMYDYMWICSGEKNLDCINSKRPGFGSQDSPNWVIYQEE
jgi:hypothetical protein